jgi:hypothetical protein
LEALVNDVECLERTWNKSKLDISDMIVEVQAQLRTAMHREIECVAPDFPGSVV